MRSDPFSGVALRLGDFGRRQFAGNLLPVAGGSVVPLQRSEIEPFVRGDEIRFTAMSGRTGDAELEEGFVQGIAWRHFSGAGQIEACHCITPFVPAGFGGTPVQPAFPCGGVWPSHLNARLKV